MKVILNTNRLTITTDDDDPQSSVTYTAIVRVELVRSREPVQPTGTVYANDPTVPPDAVECTEQLILRLILPESGDQVGFEDILLGSVTDQADWTNDNDGYVAAEEDIYAAFPSGDGGGGTVTSVAIESDNLDVSGSPIVGAGTIQINLPADYRLSPNNFTLNAANRNVVGTDDVIIAATGVCSYTETVVDSVGHLVYLVCDAAATSLTFTPDATVDGNATLVLSPGAKKIIYCMGAGVWITLN